MTDHIDIETLSAFADGEATAVVAARIEKHVAECAECARALSRVRSLVAQAKALPRELAAPPGTWEGIRGRVPSSEFRLSSRWWHNGWLASAAAIILVIGTASLMVLLRPNESARASKLARVRSAEAAPVVLAAVERNYQPTLQALRAVLDSQRGQLAPSTVSTLEHSLSVIDSAIAEARAALEADPGSAALIDLLSNNYQRKVEFLKRATTLSTSL